MRHPDRRRRLLRHTFEAGTEKVAELDGSPVKEPHGIVSAETILTRGRPSWIRPHYRNPWTFLICTRREGTAWYFLEDLGRYVGYDIERRERIGTIGPDGFVSEGKKSGSRFFGHPWRPMAYRHPSGSLAERVFDTQIFSVDFRRRTARKVFQAPPRQRILCAAPLGESLLDNEKDLAVLTRDQLVVTDPDSAEEVFRIDLDSSTQKFERLRVAQLDQGHYLVWYQPTETSVANFWEAPSLLVEYDVDGREVRRQKGPPPNPKPKTRVGDAVFGLFLPVTCLLASACISLMIGMSLPTLVGFAPFTPLFLIAALLAALLAAGISWHLAGRYAFSKWSQIAWALLGLFFGPAGCVLLLIRRHQSKLPDGDDASGQA